VGNLAIRPKMETKTSMVKNGRRTAKVFRSLCFFVANEHIPPGEKVKQFAVSEQVSPVLAFRPSGFDD
jgi:hypothetical protein